MVNFATVLTDLDGHAIMTAVAGGDGQPVPVPLTLGRAASDALLTDLPNDPPDKAEKRKRYRLAVKVRAAGELALKAEDVAYVLDRVARAYQGAAIFGRVSELLDPASLAD